MTHTLRLDHGDHFEHIEMDAAQVEAFLRRQAAPGFFPGAPVDVAVDEDGKPVAMHDISGAGHGQCLSDDGDRAVDA